MTVDQNLNVVSSRVDVPDSLNKDDTSSSSNSIAFASSILPVNSTPEDEFPNYDGRSFVEKVVGKRVKNNEVSRNSIKGYVFFYVNNWLDS